MWDYCFGLAIDKTNNIIVGRYSQSSILTLGNAKSETATVEIHHTSPGDVFDAYLAIYNPEGEPKWTTNIGAARGYSISTNTNNDLFFAGELKNLVIFWK